MADLSDQQKQRYLRNIAVSEIGELGQKKLLSAKVLVVGAGGLGSSALFYLAANGVGTIKIVDDDKVEISNLQRQIIHNLNNINQNKTESAKQKINLLNEDVKIEAINLRVDKNNLPSLIKDCDDIIDCSDNFQTRFAINQSCVQNSKKLVFAAVKEFSGQLSFFDFSKKNQPCYSCFNHNDIEQNFELPISQKGILGSVPGVLGSMQATMAINQILEVGENLAGKMIICDFLNFNFRKINLSKNASCKICSS